MLCKITGNKSLQEQEGMTQVHNKIRTTMYMLFLMSFAGFCCVCNNVSGSLRRLFEVQKRQGGQLTALPEADKERSSCVILFVYRGRGGLMVSALDSGVSAPGSSPGQGHCVVFLGKTLHPHSACLHPGV